MTSDKYPISELRSRYGGYDVDLVKEDEDFDPIRHKDETRSTIALTFTKWYFGLILMVLIGVPVYNLFVEGEQILNVEDVLSTLTAAIGVPFGFVVGYYFKGSEELRGK
jgi:hypothetical protein